MSMFVTTRCGECGIEFAVPDFFDKERRDTGKGWHCPNGHSRVYRESDADKFRRERDQAIQQMARAEQEAAEAETRARKAEAEVRRIKKRASGGVCPCCNRSFTALARHMKAKHPEFGASVVAMDGGKKRAGDAT